ncbi:hypothetical protein RG959_23885, partial [Domibacillus sp. 8LH]|uniref:hypothetical protein n=1 Tax=Domibacillus sp. 8LH TaxID=3073900 RepID=UPI0031799F64
GWKTEIKVNGETYRDDAVMNNEYSATHEGDTADLPISDDLYEALNSFFAFEVAQALCDYEEE